MPRKHKQRMADAPAPVSALLAEQQSAGNQRTLDGASCQTPDESAYLAIPADWPHGALLNVRNQGDYVVTLFPEEYDYRHPERALRFPNPAECQNFVSNWYARQSFDGRAF